MKPLCKSRQRKPRGYSAGLLNLRRNMNKFFKIPADVFHRNSDVSVGKEFYILCYFYSISALTGAASVRVKLPQIAQKMGVNHKDNVIRLINKLVNYGYVTKRKIKNSFTLFPVVNEYTLTNPNPKDCILVPDYFLDIYVDEEIIKGNMLYLLIYLYSASDGKLSDCKIKLSDIVSATGFYPIKIAKFVKKLKTHGVIAKSFQIEYDAVKKK